MSLIDDNNDKKKEESHAEERERLAVKYLHSVHGNKYSLKIDHEASMQWHGFIHGYDAAHAKYEAILSDERARLLAERKLLETQEAEWLEARQEIDELTLLLSAEKEKHKFELECAIKYGGGFGVVTAEKLKAKSPEGDEGEAK